MNGRLTFARTYLERFSGRFGSAEILSNHREFSGQFLREFSHNVIKALDPKANVKDEMRRVLVKLLVWAVFMWQKATDRENMATYRYNMG